MEYVYFSDEAVFRIRTPLIGQHSVFNTMQAALCAIRLGIDPMTVKEALAGMTGVDGRLCRVRFPKDCAFDADVFIDYAHTPDALAAALSALSEIRRKRLIVLFGCGGDRDRTKRPKMAEAAQKYADFVIVTGDNPRTEDPARILDEIVRGLDRSMPHAVIPDRREAIRFAVNEAGEGDLILLAGKGHEKYEITADGRHPFDEEQIVLEAVRNKNLS
jgi:UDP-N-acetylmuramoyl-L-alanyl-D-glutamate--2,6-diaminopimelate ligase